MEKQIEKQAIEEMAKVLEFVCDKIECTIPQNCDLCQAIRLYDEGYRKQSVGEWVVKPNVLDEEAYFCSVCDYNWLTTYGKPHLNNMYFCPNCERR